jgi:hypothetical protein
MFTTGDLVKACRMSKADKYGCSHWNMAIMDEDLKHYHLVLSRFQDSRSWNKGDGHIFGVLSFDYAEAAEIHDLIQKDRIGSEARLNEIFVGSFVPFLYYGGNKISFPKCNWQLCYDSNNVECQKEPSGIYGLDEAYAYSYMIKMESEYKYKEWISEYSVEWLLHYDLMDQILNEPAKTKKEK